MIKLNGGGGSNSCSSVLIGASAGNAYHAYIPLKHNVILLSSDKRYEIDSTGF
jgi:hypothetical protein